MNALWYLGAFLLALAPLIVFHELGHYLVARWCGVKVLRFSIGFGKPLVAKRFGRDRTEWVLAAIPFGGYVKMLDEREEAVPAELLPRAFNRQPVGRRMAIVVAGPVANLLLATAIYCGIFMTGITDLKPILGAPQPGSPAQSAGFRPGDEVRAIAGEAIVSWTAMRKRLLLVALDERAVEVMVTTVDGRSVTRILRPSPGVLRDIEGDPAATLGLSPLRPKLDPVVGAVTRGSPAGQAGVLPGDRVLAIDGIAVAEWAEVVERVQPAYDKVLIIEISRAGTRQVLRLTPARVEENGKTYGRMGVAVKPDPERYAPMLVEVRHGMLQSLVLAFAEVRYNSILSLRMIGRMITGDASLKNLSGPVTIADYAGQSAQMGWSPYLGFIALISISLGVLNLLPVPVLDGGHLMYYLVELLKGSPVSERVLEAGQRLGFGVLGLLMALALYNDIHRLIAG